MSYQAMFWKVHWLDEDNVVHTAPEEFKDREFAVAVAKEVWFNREEGTGLDDPKIVSVQVTEYGAERGSRFNTLRVRTIFRIPQYLNPRGKLRRGPMVNRGVFRGNVTALSNRALPRHNPARKNFEVHVFARDTDEPGRKFVGMTRIQALRYAKDLLATPNVRRLGRVEVWDMAKYRAIFSKEYTLGENPRRRKAWRKSWSAISVLRPSR